MKNRNINTSVNIINLGYNPNYLLKYMATFPFEKMDIEAIYNHEVKSIGNRIKELRLQLGLTQVDLEVESGINHGDWSRIENGKINFEFFTLIKIAVALGVDVSDLFTTKKKKR